MAKTTNETPIKSQVIKKSYVISQRLFSLYYVKLSQIHKKKTKQPSRKKWAEFTNK